MRRGRVIAIAANAIGTVHRPPSGPHLIAAAHAQARHEAEAVVDALQADGWTIMRTAEIQDLEQERHDLIEELAQVQRHRDRLLEDRVDAVLSGGQDVPWPLDRPFRPGGPVTAPTTYEPPEHVAGERVRPLMRLLGGGRRG